ncbi:hypothetical protein CH380_04025 [Leptospira adleri]|uniref:Uncharacterized protein n=1 Tax=Leptospira adleri TaxID=2023186 RepID=A0A2M9YTN1_9LEPT|nr:hypothetical protein CH380_04025 [Leptospira adleri]PJZ60055.1 hypothetical protein CH376_20470 [Leptospira adleri]
MLWFLQNVRQTPDCQKKSGDSCKKGDIRMIRTVFLEAQSQKLINVNMAEKNRILAKNSV